MDNVLLISKGSSQHFKFLGNIFRRAEKVRAEVVVSLVVGAQVVVTRR